MGRLLLAEPPHNVFAKSMPDEAYLQDAAEILLCMIPDLGSITCLMAMMEWGKGYFANGVASGGEIQADALFTHAALFKAVETWITI